MHRTERSLHRSRRRWKWVVVGALVLTVSWHGFERRRAVASRGWMAGVPLPALVLPVAWMSEKPGSVWKGDVNQASGFEFAVADELAARGARYGWLARAMLVAIGKRSPAGVITDRTTIKGAVCRTVFGRLYEERVLSESQGVWARSVVWAGFETRDAWHPEASVHGVLRTRTLVGGPYVAGVVNAPGRFEAFRQSTDRLAAAPGAPRWLGGNGKTIGPMTDPLRARMLEAWAWDHLNVVRDGGWSGQADTVVAMVDDMFPTDGSTRWYSVWFECSDPNDAYVGPGRPIAAVTIPATVVVDAAGGPAPVAEIGGGGVTLLARLVPAGVGTPGGDWRPVVRLEAMGAFDGEPITFGGTTSVWLQRQDQSRPRLLMSGDGCWFRLGRVPDSTARIVARTRFGGALIRDVSTALPAMVPGDRLVVRFGPEQYPPHRSVFADLDAYRVYLGVVEVELEDWTVEEINRLRVSGVWPDHAMRE